MACFKEVVGHESVKSYLGRALNQGFLPNALLFCGPEGIGKHLLALYLAQHLLKEKDISRLKRCLHPDLYDIYPDSKTGNHSIESIRLLNENVFKSPFEAKVKVFIINAAERMQAAAANAFLKTLEEPNEDSYLFLISDGSDEFLPTILSRCTRLSFSPLSSQELEIILKQKEINYSFSLLPLAQGSVKRAIEISSDTRREFLLKILSKENIVDFGDLSDSLVHLEELFDKEEKEEDFLNLTRKTEEILSYILMWYRDLHLLKSGKNDKFYFSDQLSLLKKQDLFNLPSMELIFEAVEKARLGLKRNIKLKVCLEQLLLRIDFI